MFAHKDPEFWHLIIETCERCGFEYAGAVPQKNGQTSFKKRQNPFTVLSGQLIINFRKIRNPKAVLKANLGMDIGEIVMQTIEGIIAKDTKFQTHIDVKLRIRYYMISYLRRMERENKIPTFNDIVFSILPLLKNGVTPEHQTILGVLEDIGQRVGEDGWRLKKADGNQELQF